MEQSDGAVEKRRPLHLRPGDRQDVPHQHVLQVFGFAGRLAHRQDGGGGSDRVRDADERFLRDVRASRSHQREDGGAQKRETQADPVGAAPVRVHPRQDGDRGPQGGDLRQRQVDENHPPLHYVHAQVGVDAGQDETGHERSREEFKRAQVYFSRASA